LCAGGRISAAVCCEVGADLRAQAPVGSYGAKAGRDGWCTTGVCSGGCTRGWYATGRVAAKVAARRTERERWRCYIRCPGKYLCAGGCIAASVGSGVGAYLCAQAPIGGYRTEAGCNGWRATSICCRSCSGGWYATGRVAAKVAARRTERESWWCYVRCPGKYLCGQVAVFPHASVAV
jgi:hypothetical protein